MADEDERAARRLLLSEAPDVEDRVSIYASPGSAAEAGFARLRPHRLVPEILSKKVVMGARGARAGLSSI